MSKTFQESQILLASKDSETEIFSSPKRASEKLLVKGLKLLAELA